MQRRGFSTKKETMFMKKCFRSMILLAAVSIALPAYADVLATFSIDLPDVAFGQTPLGPPPYGTGSLTLNPDQTITVSVNMDQNYTMFWFAFNTVGSRADLAATGLPALWSLDPTNSVMHSTFGDFSDFVESPISSPNSVSSLTFTLSRSSGFSSVGDIIQPSSAGFGNPPSPFDVLVWGTPTGFIQQQMGATIETSATPEPGSLGLLSAALGCLAALRLRHRV